MGSVTELSHTADVGFEVRAEGLDELFELAADGLVRARGADPEPGAAAETGTVEMERPGLDRLLVAWLRELLFRAERDDLVPSATVDEVHPPATSGADRPGADTAAPADGASGGGGGSGARLAARVAWRPSAAGPVREIKGVTYHGLEVREVDGSWHARVVLDV